MCTASDVTVTFRYEGYFVTVASDEPIHLEDHS
ncbi:hypothetical protein [Haloterrigena salifodinae]|nr:hypothetical protein [Haloterrigena salifodinae]